jgi:hypothetical protein
MADIPKEICGLIPIEVKQDFRENFIRLVQETLTMAPEFMTEEMRPLARYIDSLSDFNAVYEAFALALLEEV